MGTLTGLCSWLLNCLSRVYQWWSAAGSGHRGTLVGTIGADSLRLALLTATLQYSLHVTPPPPPADPPCTSHVMHRDALPIYCITRWPKMTGECAIHGSGPFTLWGDGDCEEGEEGVPHHVGFDGGGALGLTRPHLSHPVVTFSSNSCFSALLLLHPSRHPAPTDGWRNYRSCRACLEAPAPSAAARSVARGRLLEGGPAWRCPGTTGRWGTSPCNNTSLDYNRC